MDPPFSPQSEEYYSLSDNDGPEHGDEDAESEMEEPPVHPVPAMQAAFEESIIESTGDEELPRISLDRDAETRRQKLLNLTQYDHSLNSRWHQRAAAQHHPLMKLLAQIVFGMHLLQQEQAKSEEEVVKILQTHVNEVDAFLERTSEDFELAIKDIEERIKFLKLPMKHLDVFNVMLEEKKFRKSLLEGNAKIEKIIERTTEAKNAALLDIQTGIEATRGLSCYLDSVGGAWPREKRAIADVFGAMRGNEQGWAGYLEDLEGKGKALESNLTRLSEVIAQMAKLAASASRRSKTRGDRQASHADQSGSGSRSAPNSPDLRSKFAPDTNPPPMPGSPPHRTASLDKPLPQAPKAGGVASQGSNGTVARHIPLSQRYESPRQTPQNPEARRVPSLTNGVPMRPKTADGPARRWQARAADERANTAELLQFFKDGHSNPLRSNPPAAQRAARGSPPERMPVRSHSQGAATALDSQPPDSKTSADIVRSLSQGAVETSSHPKSVPLVLPAINEHEKPATYQPNDAQSPPRRSAFARRLSKRMRMQDPSQASAHKLSIQRPPYSPPSSDKTLSPPIDSAYASSIEKQQPSAGPGGAAAGPIDSRQPIKGFTLFPQPHSQPNMPPYGMPEQQNETTGDHGSLATSASKGRSFGSMRRYLHLRKSSKMWS